MFSSLSQCRRASHKTVMHCGLRKIILCLLVSFLLSISAVYAGVVKSAGVPRVVDGPQGEVVVESVLDDGSMTAPAEELKQGAARQQSSKPAAKPQEPNNINTIEYHDSDIAPEETVTQPKDNGTFKLIVIGAIVLLLGLLIVFITNKRK